MSDQRVDRLESAGYGETKDAGAGSSLGWRIFSRASMQHISSEISGVRAIRAGSENRFDRQTQLLAHVLREVLSFAFDDFLKLAATDLERFWNHSIRTGSPFGAIPKSLARAQTGS